MQFESEGIILIGNGVKDEILEANEEKHMNFEPGKDSLVSLGRVISELKAENIKHKLGRCVDIFQLNISRHDYEKHSLDGEFDHIRLCLQEGFNDNKGDQPENSF